MEGTAGLILAEPLAEEGDPGNFSRDRGWNCPGFSTARTCWTGEARPEQEH